jgi:hypothetical protein
MTAYTVSGNVREALQAEQSVELSPADTEAIGIVAANMAAINAVAASIGGLPDLNATVAAVNSALAAAQTAALQSQTAAGQAVSAASGVDADVQLADDWARKIGSPVEGTDVSAKQSALDAGGSASDATGPPEMRLIPLRLRLVLPFWLMILSTAPVGWIIRRGRGILRSTPILTR